MPSEVELLDDVDVDFVDVDGEDGGLILLPVQGAALGTAVWLAWVHGGAASGPPFIKPFMVLLRTIP